MSRIPDPIYAIVDGEKLCAYCEVVKLVDDFLPSMRTNNKVPCRCCDRETHRELRTRTYRSRNLRVNYGMTLEEYEEKLEAQNGVCAICHEPETGTIFGEIRWLSVDHDHATNQVRALLCSSCNRMLGILENLPEELIESGYKYLAEWKVV